MNNDEIRLYGIRKTIFSTNYNLFAIQTSFFIVTILLHNNKIISHTNIFLWYSVFVNEKSKISFKVIEILLL